MKEFEGVICRNKAEMKMLASLAEKKGYKVCWKLFNKPRYKNLIFYVNEFYDAAEYAIKFPISKEEFISRMG